MKENFFHFFGKKGNAEIIDDLSKQHYDDLIDYANCHLRDWEQSKQLVNEVFVAAFKERDSFSSKDEIEFFLLRSIRTGTTGIG